MEEKDNSIPYLDTSISRRQDKIDVDIHRKPTTTDKYEVKPLWGGEGGNTAFKSWLRRVNQMPLNKHSIKKVKETVITTGENNGYRKDLITKLNKEIIQRKQQNSGNLRQTNSSNNSIGHT
jgi:hypothetical protein